VEGRWIGMGKLDLINEMRCVEWELEISAPRNKFNRSVE